MIISVLPIKTGRSAAPVSANRSCGVPGVITACDFYLESSIISRCNALFCGG